MHVQEKQTCKVLIDVTRSVYGDRHEDDGVRPIRVYLTIIPYRDTSNWGVPVEDTLCEKDPGLYVEWYVHIHESLWHPSRVCEEGAYRLLREARWHNPLDVTPFIDSTGVILWGLTLWPTELSNKLSLHTIHSCFWSVTDWHWHRAKIKLTSRTLSRIV